MNATGSRQITHFRIDSGQTTRFDPPMLRFILLFPLLASLSFAADAKKKDDDTI